MSHVSDRELGHVERLLRYENALYEKLHFYAAHAQEEATRKLCRQLGDRSREHATRLMASLREERVTVG